MSLLISQSRVPLNLVPWQYSDGPVFQTFSSLIDHLFQKQANISPKAHCSEISSSLNTQDCISQPQSLQKVIHMNLVGAKHSLPE